MNHTDIDMNSALHRVIQAVGRDPQASSTTSSTSSASASASSTTSPSSWSPAYRAVALALIARGADVNASAPGLDGWTPLHVAAYVSTYGGRRRDM